MSTGLEKRFFELIDENESLEPLRGAYNTTKTNMKLYLTAILSVFPHYSAHDASHSVNIISAIERVLGPKRIAQLSPVDIWLILMSAYMHDVGMLITHKEKLDLWEHPEFKQFLENTLAGDDKDLASAVKMLRGYDLPTLLSWPVLVERSVTLLIAEYTRRRHASRSGDAAMGKSPISELLKLLLDGGISRAFPVIGQISQLHGSNFKDIIKTLPYVDSLYGATMHPRFVAFLIRIGDSCDVDNGRLNLAVSRLFGELPESSLLHYYKHETITRLYISEKLIAIDANVQFGDIGRELKLRGERTHDIDKESFCHRVVYEHQRWFDMIEDELQNAGQYANDIFPEDLDRMLPSFEYKILVDGKASLYSGENLRFNFSREKAFELIEGLSLYDEPRTFVRELIQNSLDALKLQMWRDIRNGIWDHLLDEKSRGDKRSIGPFNFSNYSIYEHYNIDITVSYDETGDFAELAFEDNGIGISLDDIRKNILQTGSSWDTRKDYEDELSNMPEWLRPTGSFGIGLHSIFAVTNRMRIKTRTRFETHPHSMIIHSGKREGYVFVRKLDESGDRTGTRIEMRIEQEKLPQLNDINTNEPHMPQPAHPFTAWIESYIKETVLCPLFNVRLNGSVITNALYKHEGYSSLFDLRDDPERFLSFGNYDIAVAKDYPFQMSVWDRDNFCLFLLSSIRLESDDHPKITYMGMLLGDEKKNFSYPFLVLVKMELMAEKGKAAVKADRTELKREFRDKVQMWLNNSHEAIAIFGQKVFSQVVEAPEVKEMLTLARETADLLDEDVPDAAPDICAEVLKRFSYETCEADCIFFIVLVNRFFLLKRKELLDECIIAFTNLSADLTSDLTKTERAKRAMENENFTKIAKLCFTLSNICEQFTTVHYIDYGRVFGHELGCASGNELGYALSDGLGEELSSGFDHGFGHKFGIASIHGLGNSFANALGRIFDREIVDIMQRSGISPLRYLYNDDWCWVLWLSVCTGRQLNEFLQKTGGYFSILPGYSSNYGFCDIENVGQLVSGNGMVCQLESLSSSTHRKLPFLEEMYCKYATCNGDLYITWEHCKLSVPALITADISDIKNYLREYQIDECILCFDRYPALGVQFKGGYVAYPRKNLKTFLPRDIGGEPLSKFVQRSTNQKTAVETIMRSEQVKNIIDYTFLKRADKKYSRAQIEGDYTRLIEDYVDALLNPEFD